MRTQVYCQFRRLNQPADTDPAIFGNFKQIIQSWQPRKWRESLWIAATMTPNFLNRIFLFCVILFQTGLASATDTVPERGSFATSEPIKVLFVGNSMTNRNDLPGKFKSYVESAYPGMQIEVAMLAPDGETLSGHKSAGAVAAKIKVMRPNYLILQPGAEILAGYQIDDSPRVLMEPVQFFAATQFFMDQAHAVAAVPVLFSYQLKRASASFDLGFIDYPFSHAAQLGHAKLVQAGTMISDLPIPLQQKLIAADGMHPSPMGTLAGAITIAQTLFGAPPLINGPVEIPQTLAVELTPEIYAQLNASTRKILASGSEIVPKPPAYSPLTWPESNVGQRFDARLSGLWRSRQSGIRYSFGSQLKLKQISNPGAPADWKVELTDYQLAAALRYTRTLSTSQALNLNLMSGQPYKIQIQQSKNGLHLLAWTENSQSLRQYRSAHFQRIDALSATDKNYFAALDKTYKSLNETPNNRLAAALTKHFATMNQLIPEPEMHAIMGAFKRSEWDEINAAECMDTEGAGERALAYIQAAVVLHPQSSDAQVALGMAQAKRGNSVAARQAFAAAKVNPMSYTADYINQELAKLPTQH